MHQTDNTFVTVVAKRNHDSLTSLPADTRAVHINGHPFLWLIGLLVDQYPALERIRLIPSRYNALTDSHRAAIADTSVQFVSGQINPWNAWPSGSERRSAGYEEERRFLMGLNESQRALWLELLNYGFQEVQMVVRYYGLDSHPAETQTQIRHRLGKGPAHASVISAAIHAVLFYLNSQHRCSKEARDIARRIRNRVEKLNEQAEREQRNNQLLQLIRLERLPEGIRSSAVYDLPLICWARDSGALEQLREAHPKWYIALSLCYGITTEHQAVPNPVVSGANVAAQLGCTVSNISRVKKNALRYLQDQRRSDGSSKLLLAS